MHGINLKDALDASTTYNQFEEHNSFNEINNTTSLLRICLSYLESKNIKYKIEIRPEYKFYITCPLHNNSDTSLMIREQDNQWFCYGCHNGGNIIDFIKELYNLDKDDPKLFRILECRINEEYESLTEEEKIMYDELFGTYSDPNKDIYYLESERKTKELNHKIRKYVDSLEEVGPIDFDKVARKLSCSKAYVKKELNRKIYVEG